MRVTSCTFFASMPCHSSPAADAAAASAAAGAVTLRLTVLLLAAAQHNRVGSSCEGMRGSASDAARAMKLTSEAGAPGTGCVMLGSAASSSALSESRKGRHSEGTSPQQRHTKKSLR